MLQPDPHPHYTPIHRIFKLDSVSYSTAMKESLRVGVLVGVGTDSSASCPKNVLRHLVLLHLLRYHTCAATNLHFCHRPPCVFFVMTHVRDLLFFFHFSCVQQQYRYLFSSIIFWTPPGPVSEARLVHRNNSQCQCLK